MSEKIKKGLGPKRSNLCYQVLKDIVIPAGTILREASKDHGGHGSVEAIIGFNKDYSGSIVVPVHVEALASGYFKAVIA